MAYQPLVAKKLGEHYAVWGPEGNGRTSANVLEHLDDWAIKREADVVHVNAGLHDTAREENDEPRVKAEDYENNVRRILDRLKNETRARVIWATTTPVIDEWHRRNKTFERGEEDVLRYNAVATSLAVDAGVEIDDLHEVISNAGVECCLSRDGVHMNEFGSDLLADAVARCAARSSR